MDLPELLALARRLGRDEFAKHFSHPFLARPRTTHTSVGFGSEEESTDLRLADGSSAFPECESEVRPAAARYVPLIPRAPAKDRITVGRAGACDVTLPDRSVSKMHAIFWPHEDLSRWSLSDAESRNGTWLNDERLAPKQRVPIKPGDTLRLGDVEVRFIDPALLFDLVARKLPRTQPPR
jgi:hypothetical protein